VFVSFLCIVFALCGNLISCGLPIPQDGDKPRFDLQHGEPKGSDDGPDMKGEEGEEKGFQFHSAPPFNFASAARA
jgi:hypothetical protein